MATVILFAVLVAVLLAVRWVRAAGSPDGHGGGDDG